MRKNSFFHNKNIYSIRKLSVGVGSVLIASALLFCNPTVVAAESNEVLDTRDTPTTIIENPPVTVSEQPITERSSAEPLASDVSHPESENKLNYTGTVSFIGQWTGESREKKDTTKEFKQATDKLGGALENPGLFRGVAKTFLGWSDKPAKNGKLAEGARLFSSEDTIATAFPDGLKEGDTLYGVYLSLNDDDQPLPSDQFSLGFALSGGISKFKLNTNEVAIDDSIKAEEVLPDTKLINEMNTVDKEEPKTETGTPSTASEDDWLSKFLKELSGGASSEAAQQPKETKIRTIIDQYAKDKTNEVVLHSEFKMDPIVAMTTYKNPHVGYVGPVLTNTYKNNTFENLGKKTNYTYMDLNVQLSDKLTLPKVLFTQFSGYSWRPLYVLGKYNEGETEKQDLLNIINPKTLDNLGHTKDSFTPLISNTDPNVTFGFETTNSEGRVYQNYTIRMILRAKNSYDTSGEREAIEEKDVVADSGKTIAETIIKNMTLRSLTSAELKQLFPTKTDDEIKEMVIRFSDEQAKQLAKTQGKETALITGSVNGHVRANGGKISILNLVYDGEIPAVQANELRLGFTMPFEANYRFNGTNLPTAVTSLLPSKQTDIASGTDLLLPALTDVEDAEVDGKFIFKGWHLADSNEVIKSYKVLDNVEFIGEWEFVANKHRVTYEFTSTTTGIELPESIVKLLPQDTNDYVKGDNILVKTPSVSEIEDKVHDGTWNFIGYSNDANTMGNKDEHYIGQWKFTPHQYNVTYQFYSGIPDLKLPQAIIDLLPIDKNTYQRNQTINPIQPEKLTVTDKNGKWIFTGYQNDSVTVGTDNVTFVGNWFYLSSTNGTEEAHHYNYRFVSVTSGMPLPETVQNLLPVGGSFLTNTEVVPVAPSSVIVEVKGGTWKFLGYSSREVSESGDITFVGEWKFLPNSEDQIIEEVEDLEETTQTEPSSTAHSTTLPATGSVESLFIPEVLLILTSIGIRLPNKKISE